MVFRLLFLALILGVGGVQAASQRFEASSLKYLYTITLKKNKDTVRGVFTRSEYGVNEVKYSFSGKLDPTPTGKKPGQEYIIKFSSWQIGRKGAPYDFPPAEKDVVWRFVETNKGPRIYVRMASRVYSRWKVVEIEFDQDTN